MRSNSTRRQNREYVWASGKKITKASGKRSLKGLYLLSRFLAPRGRLHFISVRDRESTPVRDLGSQLRPDRCLGRVLGHLAKHRHGIGVAPFEDIYASELR